MSTIRIIKDCEEFGQQFTVGQVVRLMTDLHDAAMVMSRLAEYVNPGAAPNWPRDGSRVIPLTSVMFDNPRTFGLHDHPDRTYSYQDTRWYWRIEALAPYGGTGVIVTGPRRAVGDVRTSKLSGARATGFQWFRNGVPIPGANNVDATGTMSDYAMTAADLAPGVLLTCEPTGMVPVGFGGYASMQSPTLVAPTFTSPPSSGAAVAYAPGAVTGVPTPLVEFELIIDGAAQVLPYTPTAQDSGKLITLTQYARNAHGAAHASVSAIVQFALVAPTVTAPPVITGTLLTNSPLTFSGPVFGGSGGAITIQWFRNGVALAAATGATYTPTASGTYTVEVTQTNSAGSATATSAGVNVTGLVDSRPRFSTGPANSFEAANVDAFFAGMTVIPGSSNGSKVAGPFTVPLVTGHYGWVAVEATAAASGVRFTDALGDGGWDGAGLPSVNGGASGSVSTVAVPYTDPDGVNWLGFRMDYFDTAWSGSIS